MNPLIVATTLLVLTTVDGRQVFVNPDQVTNLQPSNEGYDSGKKNELLVDGVRCVVGLTSGSRVTVVETCEAIRKQMEDKQ